MPAILIVDDEEMVRETVRRGLMLGGHEVAVAENGADALDMLRAGPLPDLVLSDIKMPVMDGIALALACARDWPSLPVMLMTGFADQRERASGLEAITRGVINKPFTLDDLRARVGAALAA